jgi:hypothetical protein
LARLALLNKTCRLCLLCETLIVDRGELERVIIGAGFDAAVHSQHYIVLGTMDRRTWRRGLAGGAQLLDIREHMADFKRYLKVDVAPAQWERSKRNCQLSNLRMEPTRGTGPRERQDPDRRRDHPYAAPHRTVAHDRARSRRLHGHVDFRPLLNADARALKANRKKGAGAVHLRCCAASVDILRGRATRLGLPSEARRRRAKDGGRQEARTPDLRVANASRGARLTRSIEKSRVGSYVLVSVCWTPHKYAENCRHPHAA